MKVTYVGHATLLLEICGVRVLTDPNFDSALGRILPRVSAPGIALAKLPPLDALLLTHSHADHLSFASLNRLPRTVPLFAPPAIARWLRRRGYEAAEPLAAGETATVRGVDITAASAKHQGSRYAFDRWRSASSMYLIETDNESCFFAGDTALTDETHQIVADHLWTRGAELDLALLPIGYAPWWKPGFRRGHLTYADALVLFERLRARRFVPFHWGTFHHITATAYDAVEQLRSALEHHLSRAAVTILEPGETLLLDHVKRQ